MELQLVLERLAFTIEKAKELKPKQFDYSLFVGEFDSENKCGTVCCIAGHYPNWGIGFYVFQPQYPRWTIRIDAKILRTEYDLANYHGLSSSLISYLFLGVSIYQFPFINVKHHQNLSDFTVQDVIQRFELVHNLLKTGQITPDFTA